MTFVAERNRFFAEAGVEGLGQRVSGIKRLNNAEIGVFGDQRAPRAQRRRHAPQYVSGIIHVHQERPAVNEIVCGWLDVILRDVAAAHLHVRRAQIAGTPDPVRPRRPAQRYPPARKASAPPSQRQRRPPDNASPAGHRYRRDIGKSTDRTMPPATSGEPVRRPPRHRPRSSGHLLRHRSSSVSPLTVSDVTVLTASTGSVRTKYRCEPVDNLGIRLDLYRMAPTCTSMPKPFTVTSSVPLSSKLIQWFLRLWARC